MLYVITVLTPYGSELQVTELISTA